MFHPVRAGDHFVLGTCRDLYQIREQDGDAVVATFTGSPEGWAQAWVKFRNLEEQTHSALPHSAGHLWTGSFTESHIPEGWQPGKDEGRVTRGFDPFDTEHNYVAPGDARMILPVQDDDPEYIDVSDPRRFKGMLKGSDETWRTVGACMVSAGIAFIATCVVAAVVMTVTGITLNKDIGLVWMGIFGFGAYKLAFETGLFVRQYPMSLRARKLARLNIIFLTIIVVCTLASATVVTTHAPVAELMGTIIGAGSLMTAVVAYDLYRTSVTSGTD